MEYADLTQEEVDKRFADNSYVWGKYLIVDKRAIRTGSDRVCVMAMRDREVVDLIQILRKCEENPWSKGLYQLVIPFKNHAK